MNKPKGADLSGLDSFGDFNVSDLVGSGKKAAETDSGSDIIGYAPIANFHEDAENARLEFNVNALQELADSMLQKNSATGNPRGILEPLSVRKHPDQEGHFIINGGARRYRAARMAGLKELPYIINDELDDFDKFVLNDQREQLSPLEVATFIKARLDEGYKAGQVAKLLGRPASYVSDHVIFFDMASVIRDLYDSGCCRSMQALALLHRAHKKHPEPVEAFCGDVLKAREDLTTQQVRAFLDNLKKPKSPASDDAGQSPEGGDTDPAPNAPPASEPGEHEGPDPVPESNDGGDLAPSQEPQRPANEDDDQHPLTLDGEPLSGGALDDQGGVILDADEKTDRIKKAIIQIRHDEREARLLTDRRAAYGLAWIKYDDDGHETEVDVNQVSLVAVIEA